MGAMNVYQLPDIPQSLGGMAYSISSNLHNYSHFTDAKTEAQRGQMASLRSVLTFVAKCVLLESQPFRPSVSYSLPHCTWHPQP